MRLLLVVFLIVAVASEISAQGALASQRLRCVEVNAAKTKEHFVPVIVDIWAYGVARLAG